MSFSDSVEKGKKGTAGKKKRERIDHVGVRSKHHSQHCSDKDLHQMSHVCKERITRPCAAKTLSYQTNECLSSSNANMLLRHY